MNNNDNLLLENAYKKVYLRESIAPNSHALGIPPENELQQIIDSLLKRTPQSPELQKAKQLIASIIAAETNSPGTGNMNVSGSEDGYEEDHMSNFGNADE